MVHLNPQQRRAVETGNGHVLVIAGAGSGKTRVLTERIAYLIRERNVSPERLLAFTFTNKAAGEMRSRVEGLLGRRGIPLWVGTFHATGVRILRREAKHIGFKNDFAIYDEDDSSQLVRNCIKKQGWGLDENPVYPFRNRISKWKNALVPPEEAMQEAAEPFEEKAAAIYASYAKGLKKCNAFDFDDLITRVVELFTAHPRIKERYSRQFLHVLVDEFQDTNTIQMVMIDALASRHGNLFVVGDEDQSIYGWRGATVENILQFDRVYEDTVVVKLEENYRSTNRILEAANHVIANNLGRRGKRLFSRKGEGESVRVAFGGDEIDEANLVREVITGCIREGYKRSDMAVLYRTHAQSRALENALLRGSLPYQIIGGVRFYERKEIKDLLAYLKLVNNPSDDVSFRRVVNVPRRGDPRRDRTGRGRGQPARGAEER
jgi:DNA helicase-2/ATP-dependent DNA helicase PcrA